MWRVKDPDATALTVEAQDWFTLTAAAPATKAKGKSKAGPAKH
jgi:hypothetical protein